ncbi:hypothetical protein BU25DRAFT_445270 [Macroventuria anomochaeta]|uniref:Uncharacterized protein n=1 Tax=Macroventuria anomochaeta TaxID=301207 RepID=A0ACB6SFQ6_9PLEO|nr:uncharacterized protein BU25DRAFT_445270 [Macroventuria anomochaeta]KAF2632144.1 hypothetical protein BU25DRAFT_445270 [Macroventuria anomochaeta]
MWRSNVLRVRKCSSAAAWRNTRWYSSQTSLPITIEEFNDALKDIYGSLKPSQGYFGGGNPDKLGFAISGGVDSMALASLFANARDSWKANILSHAFIVDHKVRPESTEEAEWVAEQCRAKFGMEAAVLPLTWPADFDPLDGKRFETEARTLRYQALGRACRAAGIRKLLVAHHADDQAETVLMRLANNRLRSGLQAMQPIEWIPECSGIHGVSHSRLAAHNSNIPFPTETGGIRIFRPLLSFDKSRLIATCEQHGVAWAEDKTNHLQTYTSRNAIRHVLKNHKLPAALSIESLVDVSIHMQKRVNWHKSRANQLLSNCRKDLDIEVGSLLIQFPPFQDLLDEWPTEDVPSFPAMRHADPSFLCQSVDKPIQTLTQSDWNKAKNNAIYLLAQAGQLVSPRETPPLGELAATIANIWPEFREFEETDPSQAESAGNRTNFCIYGIWWRKWDKASSWFKLSPRAIEEFIGPGRLNDREWLLTRQPLENHRPGVTSRIIHYPPSHVHPLTQIPPGTPVSRHHDEYQLFDGRWWISIWNYSTDALVLRHFTKNDLARIPSLQIAKRGGPERFIPLALSVLKPADIRFTLPALFRRDMVTKKETLIGFPTLNVSMRQFGYPKDVCSWQVRYKKLEVDSLSKVVRSGITRVMIEKEVAKFNKPKRFPGMKDGLFSRNLKQPFKYIYDQDKPLMFEDSAVPFVPPESLITRPTRKTASKAKTIPLVPVTEFERRGKSEKREGGGYNIKWEDFKDRL